jgi:hypothetical protein
MPSQQSAAPPSDEVLFFDTVTGQTGVIGQRPGDRLFVFHPVQGGVTRFLWRSLAGSFAPAFGRGMDNAASAGRDFAAQQLVDGDADAHLVGAALRRGDSHAFDSRSLKRGFLPVGCAGRVRICLTAPSS